MLPPNVDDDDKGTDGTSTPCTFSTEDKESIENEISQISLEGSMEVGVAGFYTLSYQNIID